MKTLLLLTCLLAFPIGAFEVQDNSVKLTEEEVTKCIAEGGCLLVSRKDIADHIQGLVERAHATGLHSCRNAT